MTEQWDSYKLADWVKSMGHDEIDWLKAHVNTLPPDPIIVNIGAAAGVSTMAMLEERPDALIYSCEIDPGAGELFELNRAGLDKSRVIRLGRSQEAGLTWEHETDFIFADGSHEMADVIGDIAAWLPRLKADSVIAFHDYHNLGFPGVKLGVDQAIGGLAMWTDVDTIRAFVK